MTTSISKAHPRAKQEYHADLRCWVLIHTIAVLESRIGGSIFYSIIPFYTMLIQNGRCGSCQVTLKKSQLRPALQLLFWPWMHSRDPEPWTPPPVLDPNAIVWYHIVSYRIVRYSIYCT